MYFLEMILAFMVLFGIALFFVCIFRVNTGEGMFLSVSLAIVMLFAGSSAGSFIYGVYGLSVVAVLGAVIWCVKRFYFRKMEGVIVFSPVFIEMLILYLFSLVFLYNDFIQHTDELSHWAASVKYMFHNDRMPISIGSSNYAYATSLFLLYFQKFTGYSEQGMYVASSLLMWIGFLLPFSGYGWKDWKKVAAYSVIIYFSLFTLYAYGPKSLYVDIPVVAWAGGLAGWWINRKKKKADYLIAAAGLVMVHFFKSSSGLLMSLFVLLFFVLQSRIIESGFLDDSKKMKKMFVSFISVCILIIAGSTLMIGIISDIEPVSQDNILLENGDEEGRLIQGADLQTWKIGEIQLPEKICNMINTVGLSREKAIRTMGVFVTKSFGAPLASRSNWNLAFLPFLFIILVLWNICGELYENRKKYKLYMVYTIFVALCYCAVLYFSFLFMFTYELSVELRGSNRYFSTCVCYLFVIVLCELLQNKDTKKKNMQKYVLVGIASFFLLGLNTKFIPNATAIDKENVSGYTMLSNIAGQIGKVESIIEESDRVYYICQYSESNPGGADLYNTSVIYHLADKASSYKNSPWQFTDNGSYIQLEKCNIMLSDLPTLLTQGGYTYLWVFKTDKYLTRELPQLMDCNEVKDGYLYKVVYENGFATGLELIQDLQNEG